MREIDGTVKLKSRKMVDLTSLKIPVLLLHKQGLTPAQILHHPTIVNLAGHPAKFEQVEKIIATFKADQVKRMAGKRTPRL